MPQDNNTKAPEPDQIEQYIVQFGEVLRNARDAVSLSHDDIAEELRLEVHIVVAMEEADFSALGAPVFIKGHLRAYEKLLGLSESELVALYELIDPSSSEWKVPAPKKEKVRPANLPQWGLILVLILAIVAIASFFFAADEADTTESVAAQKSSDSLLQLESEDADLDQSAAVASGMVGIEFVFADNSWVDVSDVSGRKLYGEKVAGSRLEIMGEPPFRFVLGNARSILMKVDGVVYAFPASSISRNTARFELSRAQIEEIR
ncbi:MAG: DUF4115 domain-containing protein [Gammaproteobacteria bacterium]|nr:DUF4115 domain-containing protein [Gammaproteobacteria bacterium]